MTQALFDEELITSVLKYSGAAAEKRQLLRLLSVAVSNPKLEGIEQPNGFMRIDLAISGATTIRFHIWPAYRTAGFRTFAKVHSHNWRLKSVVLTGQIQNLVYDIEENSQEATNSVFRIRYQGLSNQLDPEDSPVWARLNRIESYHAGETYNLAPGVFHDTAVCEGLSATLVAATNELQEDPRCLGRLDEAPYSRTRHQYAKEEINLAMGAVLAAMQRDPPWA